MAVPGHLGRVENGRADQQILIYDLVLDVLDEDLGGPVRRLRGPDQLDVGEVIAGLQISTVGGAFCNDPALCPPCAQDSDCASGNCTNNGDLCPALGEANWFLDSNNGDIGDECQCGDGTGDGAISSTDIAAVALCANGAGAPGACDPSLIDATGDNATTAEDIGGIVSVVNGVLTSSDLDCIRNPVAP